MNSKILRADDTGDIEIFSARLQDAVAKVENLVWLPRTRRFAAIFNRFKWEIAEKGGDNLRVRSGLHFDDVLSVRSYRINRQNPKAVLSLLAIEFKSNGGEDPGGSVELNFAGGGMIVLEVESIHAALRDIGQEWYVRMRPNHEAER